MKSRYVQQIGVLGAIGLSVAILGCGPDPENPGDECDADDGCPNGMVCAPGGDDHICYLPPAAACDPAAPDYCLDASVCSEGICQVPAGSICDPAVPDYCLDASVCVDGICHAPPGGACDPAGPDICLGDAICGSDGTCQIPPGGECDPAGPDYCLDEAVCGETADGTGICGIAEGGECDPLAPLCAGGLVCAELQAGGWACYPPLLIKGMVFDSVTTEGIADAHVIALDDQASAVSDVAVSDATGNYVLDVPVARQADGAPTQDFVVTLRASASDYQTFPGGLRTALPISSSEASVEGDGWNIQTAVTDIALIPLQPDQQGLPSISGTVLAGDQSNGVLIVAEANGLGLSAVSDLSGGYTIFNVPDGDHQVKGYAAGLQLEPASATVSGSPVTGIDLVPSSAGLGSISGSLNIVNAPGGSATSVVLVVESTFSDTFVRGDVPRGLRTPLSGPPDVTSSFTISDVPAGSYVVLAAFENDDLVRDPDPNIAGTQIVRVAMASPGTDVTVSDSFKITEALPLLGPGTTDAEPVTTAPTLRWGDDSSEDFYTVDVYNAYGELVWCLSDQGTCDGPNVPSVSGSTEVSVPYGGPMEPGMYYQFRATSWRSPGGNPGPISTTEDLRGVFYVDTAAP